MSWTAVSNGPPHFPLSRSNMNVNNNGAKVPDIIEYEFDDVKNFLETIHQIVTNL